jgi:FtsH-binding integral membrane protein
MTNDPKKTMLGYVPTQQDLHQPYPWPDPAQQQQQPQGYQQPQYQQPPYEQAPQQPSPYQPPYQQPHSSSPYQQAQSPYQQAQSSSHPQYQQTQSPYGQSFQLQNQQYPQQAQYPSYGQSQPPQAQGAYPSAAAYNYRPEAAAIVQQMQQAEQPKKGKKGERSIPGANATHGMSDRLRFIRLTYLHLLGAILAFAGLLWLLMNNTFLVTKVSVPLVRFALGGRWNWGVVLAAFMAISWVADYWASHTTSRKMQYVGLGIYVVAESLIFVPLLAIVAWKTQVIIAKGGGDPNIIRDSAYTTLGIFGALTASVFITRKDFSFLRSGLIMASGAALMLIVLSLAFGFNLGLAFSIGMVLLAAGYILYQTSQVLAHYDTEQHVAASLALFSSVALMFWYVIRIFMRMRSE